MKKAMLFGLLLLFASITLMAQNQDRILDSIELSFERIPRSIKMSCNWEMEAKFKENKHLFFINKNDSTQLEFTFFKAATLPIFNPEQTDFQLTSAYSKWISNQTNGVKNLLLTEIGHNKE